MWGNQTGGPPFAGNHIVESWFYASFDSLRYYPAEKTWIHCRGALFTECYHRYLVQIAGVDAFTTVIEPAQAAAGSPWMFRADYLQSTNSLGMALLKKGFYIITGAVPYNYYGPVLPQWNTIYQYFTGLGFSGKPVIGGTGGAAGEALAWAISNPAMVSGVCLENPILVSKGISHSILTDSLAPLAKTATPLLFISSADNVFPAAAIKEAQKKYRQAANLT